MAPDAPTLLAGETSTTNKASHTTASLSPTGSSRVFIYAVVAAGSAPGPLAITDSFGANLGAWTEIDNDGTVTASTFAYADAVSSPGSGTITVTPTINGTRWVVIVFEVATGWNTFTNTKTGTGSGATNTLTLDSSPASDSETISAVGARRGDGDFTCDNDTELTSSDIGTGTGPNDWQAVIQYDRTTPGTSCNFSDMGTTSSDHVSTGGELTATAGGRTTKNTDQFGHGVWAGVSFQTKIQP